ncbi:hypothetical protein Tco_0878271 [Tanacetum coccineum]|uniref:Uncharacterized protein n=1 Tax=Tanacetum coccineum TaxID=301880 RepID=A0ABQ5BXJ4_9ASTR
MLAPSGKGLILYQAYGNSYATTGAFARIVGKTSLLEVLTSTASSFGTAAWGRVRIQSSGGSYHPIPCLNSFHREGTTKLLQIFYDHVDNTIQKTIDYVAGGRLRKLRPDEAWAAYREVAHMRLKEGNDASSQRMYDPLHKDVTFRLGGVEREMPLLEFGCRSMHIFTHMFWPTIGDGGYNVGNTKAKSIRNPRIKLVHRCIMMTITGRKETTNRVTEIDLFYLYCIFEERVVCNIPYWLAKYLKSVRDKSVIFGGMFVTKIARSFGLLTNELVSVLNRKPPPHVYRKTSLIKMGVIMKLYEGECCWPDTREVAGEGGGDDEEGDGEVGNEGIGDSVDIYRNMSQGDWQQDERDHWMYVHTVRQFQHMSTRDNLEPHLQIDPFPRLYLMRRSLEVLRKFLLG